MSTNTGAPSTGSQAAAGKAGRVASSQGGQPHAVVAVAGDDRPPVDEDRAVRLVPEQPVAIGEPLAEAAVLGCVLRGSPEQARAVLALLDEDCWTVPQHAHVAGAAAALLARGEPADPVTVLGQLRRQGTENARTACRDAAVFLVELCEAAPSVSSAGHYARIVLEHAYRRRVQAAALRLLHAADAADLTGLCELVDAEHRAVTRAGQRATAPRLLRPLPRS